MLPTPHLPSLDLGRRRFLTSTGAWLGASTLGMAAASKRVKTVSIFHTTDLHGHILPTRNYDGVENLGGMARCVTQIRRWRRECPDSLLVDVGDVYQGTAAGLDSKGKVMIELFNRVGYDAWALGNHDFDWGREALEGALAHSKSPILTGNLELGGKKPGALEGAWKNVVPWTMKEVGGFKIALIGLVTPGLPYWLAPETLAGVSPSSPLESLRASVAEAKAAKANAIVVMGHMGWRFEDDFANPVRELLREVKDVDVFLAGHTHQDQPSWMLSGALCTQASYHGIHCGRVDLAFDLEKGKLLDKRAFTVLMDERFEADPAVIESAEPTLKKSAEQLARPVCKVTSPIGGSGRNSRLVQILCESFTAALKKQGTEVDGVFHGSFNTGELSAGQKTVADCWEILPYENVLVTARLTAAELIEIVREDAAESKSDRTLWPFELKLDATGRVERFTFKGQPVPDGDRRYTIVFNSYDAQSGGRKLMKLAAIVAAPAAERRPSGIEARGALIDYLLDRGEIS
jgi:5'-nucleotidase / UDP-sugar diphosphatase